MQEEEEKHFFLVPESLCLLVACSSLPPASCLFLTDDCYTDKLLFLKISPER